MMTTIRRNLVIGGCTTAVGLLLVLIRNGMPQPQTIIFLSSVLISAGLLFIVISIFQQQGFNEKSSVLDERILKIRAHTFMKAFSFSFTVVCILAMLDFSGLLDLDARSVIMIIFFTMGLSSTLLSRYYNRKGDINGE
ncbi:hypothetical protein [Methanoregula sp.]|jgi:hypothetical protein|uniref:hypothetical protein n=1 Tax=Methanoregula sp. TaxID=2052170 RepID=UPI003565F873